MQILFHIINFFTGPLYISCQSEGIKFETYSSLQEWIQSRHLTTKSRPLLYRKFHVTSARLWLPFCQAQHMCKKSVWGTSAWHCHRYHCETLLYWSEFYKYTASFFIFTFDMLLPYPSYFLLLLLLFLGPHLVQSLAGDLAVMFFSLLQNFL